MESRATILNFLGIYEFFDCPKYSLTEDISLHAVKVGVCSKVSLIYDTQVHRTIPDDSVK